MDCTSLDHSMIFCLIAKAVSLAFSISGAGDDKKITAIYYWVLFNLLPQFIYVSQDKFKNDYMKKKII